MELTLVVRDLNCFVDPNGCWCGGVGGGGLGECVGCEGSNGTVW